MYKLNPASHWAIRKCVTISRITSALYILIAPFALFMPDFAQAHDFYKLSKAIPGEYVAQLAPVFDFDGDGCLPSAGISRRGQQNGGLKTSGSLTGECRSFNFLDTSNTFHRHACTSQGGSTYCGHIYALYFEKDQVRSGFDPFGHRHDWEYAVIWTKNGRITHGSASAHDGVQTRTAFNLPFENGHMKVVYHKDGLFTHALRFAKRNERAENPYRRFVTPTLVSWFNLSGDRINNSSMRAKLNSFDYGKAILPITDRRFWNTLNKFKPSRYPAFPDPRANYQFTPWFSEENPNGQTCPPNYVVTGVRCAGRYCDNKQLKCSRVFGLNISGRVRISRYFSEEGINYYKSDSRVVVGMRCSGRYCDKIALMTRRAQGRRGIWTPSFSEEAGQGNCPGKGYVAGVSCSGRYCDNLSLYCKE